MPNWELKNCCKHDQAVFLIAIAVYSLVILLLWRTFLMTPFKLIAVFLHETSHAVACKLTCGQVRSPLLSTFMTLTAMTEEGNVHAVNLVV
uniref:Uncharacterized protein MANES_02G069400 n=1 Tax=Rhizophora mucronata TaxID=61149 RepID=A0A2P2LTL5_RHIMU